MASVVHILLGCVAINGDRLMHITASINGGIKILSDIACGLNNRFSTNGLKIHPSTTFAVGLTADSTIDIISVTTGKRRTLAASTAPSLAISPSGGYVWVYGNDKFLTIHELPNVNFPEGRLWKQERIIADPNSNIIILKDNLDFIFAGSSDLIYIYTTYGWSKPTTICEGHDNPPWKLLRDYDDIDVIHTVANNHIIKWNTQLGLEILRIDIPSTLGIIRDVINCKRGYLLNVNNRLVLHSYDSDSYKSYINLPPYCQFLATTEIDEDTMGLVTLNYIGQGYYLNILCINTVNGVSTYAQTYLNIVYNVYAFDSITK